MLMLEDRPDGRLLGAQLVGHLGAATAKRIDIFATLAGDSGKGALVTSWSGALTEGDRGLVLDRPQQFFVQLTGWQVRLAPIGGYDQGA